MWYLRIWPVYILQYVCSTLILMLCKRDLITCLVQMVFVISFEGIKSWIPYICSPRTFVPQMSRRHHISSTSSKLSGIALHYIWLQSTFTLNFSYAIQEVSILDILGTNVRREQISWTRLVRKSTLTWRLAPRISFWFDCLQNPNAWWQHFQFPLHSTLGSLGQ